MATITDEKKQILNDIFWEMNSISSSTTTEDATVIIESDDGHGNIVAEEVIETRTTLHIVVVHKTADELAAQYGFDDENKEQRRKYMSKIQRRCMDKHNRSNTHFPVQGEMFGTAFHDQFLNSEDMPPPPGSPAAP